jgi:hypothetical protein
MRNSDGLSLTVTGVKKKSQWAPKNRTPGIITNVILDERREQEQGSLETGLAKKD